jgi:uncharacterized protein YbjT (DUF2867 family)
VATDGVIALTGATGYVGGRLLPALVERGHRVRCLSRTPERIAGKVPEGVEVARADLLERSSLEGALEGAAVAVYLVHSMGSGTGFEEADRRAAENFAAAAAAAGVGHIVYLGGLGRGADLSPHLRSRQEVGEILRGSGVPVLELRASIVIGSGSLSFEMIRALVERLPVLITPRWALHKAQPIAIEDVVAYLVAATEARPERSRVYEIGGPDRLSYVDLMREYARLRGLRRTIVTVPVLTPRLSSLWLGLVTPLYARVGRELIESVRNDTVVTDDAAGRDFPVRPMGNAEAMRRALQNEDREFAATRWSNALSPGRRSPFGGESYGMRRIDSRSITVRCPPEAAFQPIAEIGGVRGWYYADPLWQVRGAVDRLVGGVGMRRGRRHPTRLEPGEPLDFWRVEAIEPGRLLRLRAEMRLPGRAWLQFEVEPAEGGATIRQTAVFDPRGEAGRAYWYALYPVHDTIFAGMLRRIGEEAERRHALESSRGDASDGSRPAGGP